MHWKHQRCPGSVRVGMARWMLVARAMIAAIAIMLLWALNPGEAFAQLPRVGGGLPGVGNVGVPNIGGIGGGSGLPGSDSSFPSVPDNSIGIGVRIPSDFGATAPTLPSVDPLRSLPKPGTITNTLANPSPGRAAGKSVAPRRSGVPPAGERRFVPDEVVVRLPSNLSRQALDELASRHRLTRIESQSIALTGTTFHRWRISDRRTVSDVIRALETDGAVGAAQPNYRFALQQNDARPAAAVAEVPAMQYAPAKLRLPEAHRLSTGSKVLVAVIDSGVDTSHPEIADMVAGSFDAVNSSPARRQSRHCHGRSDHRACKAQGRCAGGSRSGGSCLRRRRRRREHIDNHQEHRLGGRARRARHQYELCRAK